MKNILEKYLSFGIVLFLFFFFLDGPKLSDLIDIYLVLQIASNLNIQIVLKCLLSTECNHAFNK